MEDFRKMKTNRERVPFVEAFIERIGLKSNPYYHWHGMAPRRLEEEWFCDACGDSSHYYTTGLKREYGDEHLQPRAGMFRIEGEERYPKVCESCDRIVHKLLGTSNEV